MGPRTNWTVEAYMPSWAKEKGGWWFWTSKGKKTIHSEMEKHMFGKQMFAGLSPTMGCRENFDRRALRSLSLSITLSSQQTILSLIIAPFLEQVLSPKILLSKPKPCWFDSQSGHMPGLQATSSVEGVWQIATHWSFSPSFSFPSPLSKNK